ncbi:MAG TPA: hypothetical protein VFS21_30165 [Roseiflexaceae bacterium]|nr:hypothetical protein [Roseiflexaceae bacterium]
MGRKPSISEEQGKALLEAYQRLGSKSAAAREIGVSEDAAMRFFAGMPRAATPAVAQQRETVERLGASLWHTHQALEENYDRLLKLYERLDQGITVLNGDHVTLTPVATNISALSEIRRHIETAVDMASLLIAIEEVRKFQAAVLEAIHEADPATRQRVIAKLRERGALGLVAGRTGEPGAH